MEDIEPFVIRLYRFSTHVPVLKDCGWKDALFNPMSSQRHKNQDETLVDGLIRSRKNRRGAGSTNERAGRRHGHSL